MIRFNDLKASHPFYFLEKGTELKYYTGTVVNVSIPYFPTNTSNGTFQVPNFTNKIMDITVQVGEKTKTYTVSENSSISETPDSIVIASDKEAIVREVEAVRLRAEEELKKVEQHKSYIKSGEAILEQLNPTLAERKEQDRRIKNLEDGFNDMKSLLRDISSTLKEMKQ